MPRRPKPSFIAEADRIAAEIARYAIRRGPAAAWIGLDWLGDSEVFQLVCLGPDLYNGATGIALFLAAHAAATGHQPSGELALAALSHLRKNLTSRNVPRLARALGIGAATGLGSIVYALAVMAKCLDDRDLLADAEMAATLVHRRTDRRGQATRRHGRQRRRDIGTVAPLSRYRIDGWCSAAPIKCGEHLLAQPRIGAEGRRSWIGQEFRAQALATNGSDANRLARGLNGMSHGAAGFAYALSSLAAATGRDDFAAAAAECIAFEDSTYDADASQLARSGAARTRRRGPASGVTARPASVLRVWACKDLAAKLRNWQPSRWRRIFAMPPSASSERRPAPVDTLCCGTLGRIEFICEAAGALGRADLRELAARRLTAVLQRAAATGDYRWNSGKRQFNLGLFRGLSGVGYTLLRQARRRRRRILPNVLIWE